MSPHRTRRSLAALAIVTVAGLVSVACGGDAADAGTDNSAARATSTQARVPTLSGERPVVIGHRGSSGTRPEHTLASYEEAARAGADYVEPDLVPTKDRVLVSRHEPHINETTDVADRPEFADRRAKKTIDGTEYDGWFVEDFTLAELKTLRAKERLPELRPGNTAYDGQFEIPTFDEVVDLTKRLSAELGRDVGIYPETKHPAYLTSIGLDPNPLLVDALNRHDLNRPGAKVTIQSFEVGNLKALRPQVQVRIAQLVDEKGGPADNPQLTYADMLTPDGLAEIKTYADGVAPYKNHVIPRDADGALLEPTGLVTDAHEAGLSVTTWTFRSENEYLPKEFRSGDDPATHGDSAGEYNAFFDAGVDEVFSDFPADAVAARDAR